MKKAQCNINLETLAGGAFAEKLNAALSEVAENIQNPNTDATATRGISISIKLKPDKTRLMASTTISVHTKLAPAEAVDTQMVIGKNMKTGKIEIAEYDHVWDQVSIDEDDHVSGEQGEEQTTGKIIDLRNRGKKQESKMTPGRDFSTDTGEVYETTAVKA